MESVILNNKLELPDEIWDYIKDFAFDWQRSHKLKLQKILSKNIELPSPNFCWKKEAEYKRWTLFPPPHNTNEIRRNEYAGQPDHFTWIPPPDLPLVSIEKRPNANINSAGWWCGYGWVKNLYYK